MPDNEDFIDLKPYIRVLVKNWWLILLITSLFAISALFYTQSRKPVYKATAMLLLTRTRSSLSLAEKFPTVSEPIDTRARTEALLTIIQSDSLALEVAQKLGSQLPEEMREYVLLKKRILVSTKGDAILIDAVAYSPEMAALLANTWAELSTARINAAYGGERPIEEVSAQVLTTKLEYEAAQAALEEYLQSSKDVLLNKEIAETQALLDSIVKERTSLIEFYSSRRLHMAKLATQVEALKQQLDANPASKSAKIGDTIALIRTRSNTMISEENSDINSSLQLGITLELNKLAELDDASPSLSKDIEKMIALAKNEEKIAEENLRQLKDMTLKTTTDGDVAKITARLRDLRTQLEQQAALERDLTTKRDVAWEAYKVLTQKQTEMLSAARAADSIAFVSRAVIPAQPEDIRGLRFVMVISLGGFLLSVLGIILVKWWKDMDLFSKDQPEKT